MDGSRSYGMAPNPISFVEIEAYCRTTLTALTAGNVRLIRDLDSLCIQAAAPAAGQSAPTDAPVGVAADDTDGLKAMFTRIAAQRNAAIASRGR